MKKKVIFGMAALLLVYVLIEGLIFCALFLLRQTKGVVFDPIPAYALSNVHKEIVQRLLADDFYLKFSPSLGWTIRPDAVMHFRGLTDETVFAKSNSQGIRADRDYEPTVPEGVLRLAAFGDSFTHGDDVRNDETWAALFEKKGPAVEVMNFGVPAYGIDQAYLRYLEEGVRFSPRIVLICFFTENIIRTVNVFRPFLYPSDYLPLSKPRFVLRDGRLVLLENFFPELSDYRLLLDDPEPTLARLGANDFYFKAHYHKGPFDFLPSVRLAKISRFSLTKKYPDGNEIFDLFYQPDTEPFRVTAKILETFYNKVLESGSLPVIVLIPAEIDVFSYPQTGKVTYALLRDHLLKKELRIVDVMEGFAPVGYDKKLFALQGHYSAAGNAIAAETIYRALERQGLLNPRVVETVIEIDRNKNLAAPARRGRA